MKERRQTACKGGQINTLLEAWCEFKKNQAHHHKILNVTSEMKQTLYSTPLDTSVRYRISICSMLAGFLPQQMFDRQQDVLKVWWYTDAEKVTMVSVEALREQTVQRESQQEGFSWVQPGCIIISLQVQYDTAYTKSGQRIQYYWRNWNHCFQEVGEPTMKSRLHPPSSGYDDEYSYVAVN